MGKSTSRSLRRVVRNYGPFPGGDPRQFKPDPRACTQDQRSRWRSACGAWREAESRGTIPRPEDYPDGWVKREFDVLETHFLDGNYGIGWYTYEVIQRPPDLPGQQTMLFEGHP
jgi:hypothetical protein